MLHIEIRIRGRIAQRWSSWFEDLRVEYTDDETVLSGHVLDQAALYGLLSRLRDLGLSLLSVETSQGAQGAEHAAASGNHTTE